MRSRNTQLNYVDDFIFVRSSKWSKYDAVSMKRTQTDHWAKMKHLATTFDVKMPEVFVLKKRK